MSMAKWEDADLEPEPGCGLLPGMHDAQRYRGLVIYQVYDMEMGGCAYDEWEVVSEAAGDVVLVINALEERAYALATKLAEMLDWTTVTDADWTKMTLDPVFLSFMAANYEEVSISIRDDGLDAIVPHGPEQTQMHDSR